MKTVHFDRDYPAQVHKITPSTRLGRSDSTSGHKQVLPAHDAVVEEAVT